MKKILSLLLVLIMVFTLLPHQVFASEAETQNTDTEISDNREGARGMDLAARAAEEPLVIHYFLASPGNITNPNGSYVNYYGPNKSLSWWPESYAVSNIKQDANWNTIYSQQGIRNVYDEDVVTKYVASWPTGSEESFKDFGSVTINGRVYSDTEYEIKWVSVMCRDNDHPSSGMRCNQRTFEGEHIHIDGLLVEKIQPGEMEVFKAIPEAQNTTTTFQFALQKMRQPDLMTPPVSGTDMDTSFSPITLTASIPAGKTEAKITGGSEISFGYYKLTEISNLDWEMDSIVLTDERGRTQTSEADALYICIAPNGTVQYSTAPSGPYTVMNHVAIQNERKPVAVTYQWRVYNTNGTYTSLPVGAPDEPASEMDVKVGSQYVYDTEYLTGTSFYDYDNGLLYTFHGWDTYSHSSVYNPMVSTGYYALDDGDSVISNNPTIEITADTYIYGYWTVTELKPSSAHIAIEKVFLVDGVQMPMADAEDLWFLVDTGIDRDDDGDTTVEVRYPMIAAATGGEYKIPVYQYDTPFVFTEQNAEVPGYTRTTTITVSGEHITAFETNGDSVTVTMDPVYEGENVHLGTVTYTNIYTKNVGTPIDVYPTLTLLKTAADTQLAQDGVGFTLYSDEACTNAVKALTTADGGLAYIDFANIENVAPGTYYLKETAPLAGYYAGPNVYVITLETSQSVEELRNGQYVQVTYYTLSVEVPEGSTAFFTKDNDRLHIYNQPVVGSLNLSKDVLGITDADMDKLDAIVIVHGPITRDGQEITDIGSTWELELDSENNWAATLSELSLGEYLIHESFASVHGYTWTGVTYGDLETTVYNGITSGVFKVESETAVDLTLTNTYEEWIAADFYIKKVDERNHALAGAVFTLSSDEAGNNVVMTKTTGADGYAHFDGFTVPEGQDSVTYYLKETKAPSGYYLSGQVYQVVIQAVTAEGKTTYEPTISLFTGRDSGFNITTDLLTVYNYPVLGELTITKAFTDGFIPEGLTGISVQVDGPNGYSRTAELNNANNWGVTLENLVLGEYTITELDANIPGYDWNVAYSSTTVTLAERNPGSTTAAEEISGTVTITNTYTPNNEYFEVPTSLTIRKVDETGAPLAGAVFTITRYDRSGESVLDSVSFTTGVDGTATFGLLYGFADEDGNITEGKYIIEETKAPEGYLKTDATWTVTVTEDDGQLRVELNENRNVFEHFWDWIVGNVSPGTWANGVLEVTNYPVRGELTVNKAFTNDFIPEELTGLSVRITGPNSYERTVELNAANGWSVTLEDLSLGAYTVQELDANIPGYDWNVAYSATTVTLAETNPGGTTAGDEISGVVRVTNAYTRNEDYIQVPTSLTIRKVDEAGALLAGAEFTVTRMDQDGVTVLDTIVLTTDTTGTAAFDLLTGFADEEGVIADGIYIIEETKAPAGYLKTDTTWTVTVTEDDGQLRMELNENRNVFEHFWDWIVGNVTPGTWANGVLEVVNYAATDVHVQKVWYGEGREHPASVDVTLFCNGEAYETVTLSEENNWSYTWEELPAASQWTVDEPSVPSGYTKTITRDGNNFVVTNTYEDIPKTGDFTNLFGSGMMTAVGVAGFGTSVAALLAPRKKKKEEQEEDS